MTDPREIIAKANFLCGFLSVQGGRRHADAAIESLHTAGYRILGPDELDPVTLERAAEMAETCPDTPFIESRKWRGNLRKSIPATIRAMQGGKP